MDSNFYIYRHIRLDTNTPFYVGKGKDKRAYSKQRNNYWHRIVSKYGYVVEMIEENLTEDQAFAKEIELIKLYKSQGFCEANFTDGGDGASGLNHSEEIKKRISEANKGQIPWNKGKTGVYSGESLKKMSEETKGEKNSQFGKTPSKETRKKLSDANKGENNGFYGKTHSEETREGISKARKGKKLSKETRKKMSEAQKGENNHNYGKTTSEETKKRISESNKGKIPVNRKKVICTKTNIIYVSAKEAAELMNMKRSSLVNQLNGHRKNKTSLQYYKEV